MNESEHTWMAQIRRDAATRNDIAFGKPIYRETRNQFQMSGMALAKLGAQVSSSSLNFTFRAEVYLGETSHPQHCDLTRYRWARKQIYKGWRGPLRGRPAVQLGICIL